MYVFEIATLIISNNTLGNCKSLVHGNGYCLYLQWNIDGFAESINFLASKFKKFKSFKVDIFIFIEITIEKFKKIKKFKN